MVKFGGVTLNSMHTESDQKCDTARRQAGRQAGTQITILIYSMMWYDFSLRLLTLDCFDKLTLTAPFVFFQQLWQRYLSVIFIVMSSKKTKHVRENI